MALLGVKMEETEKAQGRKTNRLTSFDFENSIFKQLEFNVF